MIGGLVHNVMLFGLRRTERTKNLMEKKMDRTTKIIHGIMDAELLKQEKAQTAESRQAETEVIIFLAIIDRYTEFMQCQKHLHLRGMQDVLKETKLLLDKMKKENLGWEDLHKYLLTKDAVYNYDNNQFFIGIKKYLETDSQK